MALEAITSHYLSNFNPNELRSSSSFAVAVENNETREVGFSLKGKEPSSFPPFPQFSETHLASYSSSSSSAASCHSAFCFGPMEVDEQRLGFPAENQKKRRRSRSSKNSQDLENQRMTHITVERNRRMQMNERLAMLRSLMPESYIQRGDQASIVGGAIDFVKELEQLVLSLEVEKRHRDNGKANFSHPFSSFFTCPQYSFTSRLSDEFSREEPPALADIEVTMSETHANLKVLSLKRPKQLLQMVAGLQSLHLTVLHLNVTTLDPFVLYFFSTKVEEDCTLVTVDDIAAAAHQLLTMIQEEAVMAGLDAKLEEYS